LSKQLGKGAGIAIVAVAAIVGMNIQQFMKGGSAGFKNPLAASRSHVSPADQAMNGKLEAFIGCLNRVDAKLQKSIPGYRGYFVNLVKNPDSSPDKGGFFHGFKIEVYERNNQFSKECIDGLRTATAQQPADAILDASGKSYADTLEKLVPLLNAADTYYDQSNYKDDKFAKGKEIDGQLEPLFDRLLATSDQIRNRVHAVTMDLRERELVAIEKAEGKAFDWYTLNVMFEARKAVDGLDALVSASKLSADAVRPIEEKLAGALEDGKQYAAAHSGQKTAKGNTPYWFELERTGNNLIASIKELRRGLASNADQRTIQSAYAGVEDKFNSLVSDYNLSALYR
jgi:hypothetical protein